MITAIIQNWIIPSNKYSRNQSIFIQMCGIWNIYQIRGKVRATTTTSDEDQGCYIRTNFLYRGVDLTHSLSHLPFLPKVSGAMKTPQNRKYFQTNTAVCGDQRKWTETMDAMNDSRDNLFGLISWFYGISTFMGYLMPKSSNVEE